MQRGRLRDLGLAVGELPTGEHNAITDVAGVRVGHETVIADEPATVRTGVTVVVPEHGRIWSRHLFAGLHVLNGNGEMTGFSRLSEYGLLGGPIALTGTHSIGAVHEAMLARELEIGTGADFLLPVITECSDGWLSDPRAFAVRAEHVQRALDSAASGPVAEGSVGGGTGLIAHELKAGIGTASRRVEVGGGTRTVGVLVQANYGRRSRLRLDGRAIGPAMPTDAIPPPWPQPREQGSIVAVIATDAPLLSQQCRRLAQRAGLGVGRAGGTAAPGSGDLFLAFSTASAVPALDEPALRQAGFLADGLLEPLFAAVIEAVEESIWNALCAARTMTGWQGRTAHAIPLDGLAEAAGGRAA